MWDAIFVIIQTIGGDIYVSTSGLDDHLTAKHSAIDPMSGEGGSCTAKVALNLDQTRNKKDR